MPRPLSIYLATLRKRCGLTQDELALLFSLSPTALSRFESRARRPSVDLLLGTEVVFGVPPRTAFPGLYREIEEQVMARARVLYERVEARSDLGAEDKLTLLLEMIARIEPFDPAP
jgi:transcriptional regulator with XRE-family HTH domain